MGQRLSSLSWVCLDALERTVRMLRGRGIAVRLLIAPYESPDRFTNMQRLAADGVFGDSREKLSAVSMSR